MKDDRGKIIKSAGPSFAVELVIIIFLNKKYIGFINS